MSRPVDMYALHNDALKAEIQRLRQKIAGLEAEISNAADALTKPGRDAYAVAGSLEDGINTDHLHAAAERDGLTAEVEQLKAEVATLTKQREMLRLAVDDLRSHNQHTTSLWQAAEAERDEARAEVERLKKALSEAHDYVREEIAQAIEKEIRRGFPQPVTAGLIQAQEIVRGVR